MKIKTGGQMPDFTFGASDGREMKLSEIYSKNERTLLLFLRYYGCTLCQLDLREYREAYADFRSSGAEVIVVLQSTPDVVNETPAQLPYIIACDPDQTLYRRFEIVPAKSMLGMLSLKVFPKMNRAKKAGLAHGRYEGEEKQLPAAFLIDRSGRVVFSRYAKNLTDLPTPQQFLAMVSGRKAAL